MKQIIIEDKTFYPFSITHINRENIYYSDNAEEYNKWIEMLRCVLRNDCELKGYILGEVIGSGKFGVVRSAVNKLTNEKVAIKFIEKITLNETEANLIRNEIEILKICQHPCIVRLKNILENEYYIFIIMELCTGNDLFSHLEDNDFKLSEKKSFEIIHKLSTAIYYLHSYGIIHRDLKPENILMYGDNCDSEIDIRLLDFGLSKIKSINELCSEPFGTISYVAPEILVDRPYNYPADMWSLGIISYLLLSGSFPFSHCDTEEEVAKNTINNEITYNKKKWDKISPEGRAFVEGLLCKDPKKRLTISEVLIHPWVKMNSDQDIYAERIKSTKNHNLADFECYTSTTFNSM